VKRLTSLLLAIAALLALAACGGKPALEAAVETGVALTTTITTLPATTTEITTTTQRATTSKLTTQTSIDPLQKQKDIINESNRSAEEKEGALKILDFKRDKNGVFYLEIERDQWTIHHPYWLLDKGMIYDLAPPLIQMIYGTVRVKFQHKEQDWLFQMWKGRYALCMMGGEIGIFTKDKDVYMPAEAELEFSMDVYQHDFATGKTAHLFTRETATAWWYNGFMPGAFHEYNKRSEIIMVGTIKFPDQEMLRAFEASLAACGFSSGIPSRDGPETYSTNGNTLKFSWQYIDQDA